MKLPILRLRAKLLTLLVSAALVPAAVITLNLDAQMADALEAEQYNKLSALQRIKRGQIEQWLRRSIAALKRRSDTAVVEKGLRRFPDAARAGFDGEAYAALDALVGMKLRRAKDALGLEDLILVAPDGRIVWTALVQADRGTNLDEGEAAATNLAAVVAATADGEAHLVDFARYAPAGGAPAAFVATPVLRDGERLGTLAARLPVAQINALMQDPSGMGETGESFLVGRDHLMRSDSRFASASTILGERVDTELTRAALSGQAGVGRQLNHHGVPSFTAYSAIDVAGVRWAVVSEISEEEALASVTAVREAALAIILVTILAALLVASFMAERLRRPILGIHGALLRMAKGDLTVSVPEGGGDELGEASAALNATARSLCTVLRDVGNAAQAVASGASQIDAAAGDLATRTHAEAAVVEEVSTTVDEMSVAIERNATEAAETDALVQQVAEQVTTSATDIHALSSSMAALSDSSREIGQIVDLVDELSFQTNLLALNAAVEAARAGEHGRGFAVVAGEVRRLAGRSAEAARQIQGLVQVSTARIGDADAQATRAAEGLAAVRARISNAAAAMASIAAASEEQSAGVKQITDAMTNLDGAVAQNAAMVEEAATAVGALAGEAASLQQKVSAFDVDRSGRGGLAGPAAANDDGFAGETAEDLFSDAA